MRVITLFSALLVAPAAFAGDVTPDLINGSGNTNGNFTIDRSNGVEVALRGKLRHNASGAPENTFPWDGSNGYDFMPGVAPTQSFPTAEWSFEWSINSDFDGTSGLHLDDLTYSLSMTSTNAAEIPMYDVINGTNLGTGGTVQWDHGIGTNATPNGGGTSIPNSASNAAGYADLLANNNVAQNSWKPHWFAADFDPTLEGTYTFSLSAFDLGGNLVASTTMDIRVADEPRDAAADAAAIADSVNAQSGSIVVAPGNDRLSTERVESRVEDIHGHATANGCSIDGLKAGIYTAGVYTGVAMPDVGADGVVDGVLDGGPKTSFGTVEDQAGNPTGVIGDTFARYNRQAQIVADAGGTRFEAGRFERVLGTNGIWYGVSGDCPGVGAAQAFTGWFRGGLEDVLID